MPVKLLGPAQEQERPGGVKLLGPAPARPAPTGGIRLLGAAPPDDRPDTSLPGLSTAMDEGIPDVARPDAPPVRPVLGGVAGTALNRAGSALESTTQAVGAGVVDPVANAVQGYTPARGIEPPQTGLGRVAHVASAPFQETRARWSGQLGKYENLLKQAAAAELAARDQAVIAGTLPRELSRHADDFMFSQRNRGARGQRAADILDGISGGAPVLSPDAGQMLEQARAVAANLPIAPEPTDPTQDPTGFLRDLATQVGTTWAELALLKRVPGAGPAISRMSAPARMATEFGVLGGVHGGVEGAVKGATTGALMGAGGEALGVVGESIGGGVGAGAMGGSPVDVATMAAVPLAMRGGAAAVRGIRGRPGDVHNPIVIDMPRLEPPAPVVEPPRPEGTKMAEVQPPAPGVQPPATAPTSSDFKVDPLKLAEATGYTPEPSPESTGITPRDPGVPDPANTLRSLKRAADVYRGPTRKGLEILRRKRGGAAVAEVDVDKLLKEYKAIDSGQRTPEEMQKMHLALRGEADPKTLSEPQRAWVQNVRGIQDRLSADLIRELQVAHGGETLLTKRIRENIGTYVRETLIPRGPTERVKALFGRENQLRSEQFKRKRDAWTVVVGKAGYKMGSEADARQLAAELASGQETPLMQAAAADHLTSTATMLAAAKQAKVRVEPPLTETERIEAGFSRNPMYSAAVSIMDTAHNIEVLRMARTMLRAGVAKAPPTDVVAGGEEAIAAWAKENGLRAVEGNRNRIGVLEGTYAPKRIAGELNELSRAPKEWERIWRTYLDAWKTSKTVLNPPTHFRNTLGNIPFADFADASPLNPGNWGYYKSAVGEIANKGPAYRYLLRQGVIGGEYVGNEVRKLHPMLEGNEAVDQALITWARKGVAKAGRLYNAEDQVYKLAAYLKYRDVGIRGPWKAMRRGASAKEAAREVNLWFPNYGTVSKPFRSLSRTPLGGPFLSFFEQATRIAGRASIRRPLKVAKWLMFPQAMTMASIAALGIQDDERELIDSDRSWFEPLIPWRDAKGAAGTLDLRYTIPLANEFTNLYEFAQGKRHAADLPIFMQQAPVEAAAEIMMNTERFTRREVYKDEDALLTKAAKSAMHMLHSAAPYPTFLDYGRERLQRAFHGVSDESVSRAIAGALLGTSVRQPFIGRKEAFAQLKDVALTDPQVKQVVDRLLDGDVARMDYDALTQDLEKNERFQDLLDLYNEVYRRDERGPYMDRGKLSVGERLEAIPRPYGPSKADEPATERGILSSIRRDVGKEHEENPTERVQLRERFEDALKQLRAREREAKNKRGPRLDADERRALRTMEAYDRAISVRQKRLKRRNVAGDAWDENQTKIDEYMTRALRAAGLEVGE